MMKSKEEIKKALKENIEVYKREFSALLIPNEKFGMACALKGYIDGLRWVLEMDGVE